MSIQIKKVETTYHAQLNASEYDFLEVIQALDNRITIKFLETRWRTIDETIDMLKEIVTELESLK